MSLVSMYNINSSNLSLSSNKYNLNIYLNWVMNSPIHGLSGSKILLQGSLKSLLYPCTVQKLNNVNLMYTLSYIVYSLGVSSSLPSSDCFVLEGNVLVNGKVVNSPFYSCCPGDVININGGSIGYNSFSQWYVLPGYLLFDSSTGSCVVLDFKGNDYLWNSLNN